MKELLSTRRASLVLFTATLTIGFAGCSSIHVGNPVACGAIERPASVTPPDDDLRVVSWNVHGTPLVAPMDGRIARIAGAIRARSPDIVFLQEVWLEGDAKSFAAQLGSAYRRVADSTGVSDSLWGHVFGYRKGGLMTFLRQDATNLDMPSSTFIPFVAQCADCFLRQRDRLEDKGMQQTKAQVRGEAVTLINTHLQSQHPKDGQLFERVRELQIDEVVARATRATSHLVVVAGDFNTAPQGPDLPLYERLTMTLQDMTRPYRESCCTETPGVSGGAPCTCSTQVVDESKTAEWTDYVLVLPQVGSEFATTYLRMISNQTVDCPYSDHDGLELGVAQVR